ncbi:MAG: hypothetical protein KGL48_05895 [Sphingomonadales bacterium]|nr:hypothetical protein [Sphingomonadales bacterium]MDE2569963.1 hypothetical protein [Sphingomonadales bacterium]
MKPFTTIAVIVLALAALVHLVRLVSGFDIVVAGHVVPRLASVMGFVVAAGLAFMVAREARG